jgi:hypothetical protein
MSESPKNKKQRLRREKKSSLGKKEKDEVKASTTSSQIIDPEATTATVTKITPKLTTSITIKQTTSLPIDPWNIFPPTESSKKISKNWNPTPTSPDDFLTHIFLGLHPDFTHHGPDLDDFGRDDSGMFIKTVSYVFSKMGTFGKGDADATVYYTGVPLEPPAKFGVRRGRGKA